MSHQINAFINWLESEEVTTQLLQIAENNEIKTDKFQGVVASVAEKLVVALKRDGVREQIMPDTLRGVERSFSAELDLRELELSILETLLQVAVSEFSIKSSTVPVITRVIRDQPILKPNQVVHAMMVGLVKQTLLDDLAAPSSNYTHDQQIGRLSLYLFFFMGLNNLKRIALFLTESPRPQYIDGAYFCHLDDELPDLLLTDTGALLYLALQHGKVLPQSISDQRLLSCINEYLARWPECTGITLNASKLDTFRAIDTAFSYSALDFEMMFGKFNSTPLDQHAWVRLIGGRSKPYQLNLVMTDKAVSVRKRSILKGLESPRVYISAADSLSHLNLLLTKLKAAAKLTRRKQSVLKPSLIQALTNSLDNAETATNYYLSLIVAWIIHLLRHGGAKAKNLKFQTIHDYVFTLAPAFFDLFCDYKPEQLTADNWVDLLNQVGRQIPNNKYQGIVSRFALFLKEGRVVDDIDLGELDSYTSINYVDANVLGIAHAEHILERLWQAQTSLATEAYFLLIICFFAGLRRGEVSKLRFDDIEFASNAIAGHGHCNLMVRRNELRDLKTRAATRRLPLDALVPERYLQQLINWLQVRRESGEKAKSVIFSQAESALALVTEAMKLLTGDERLRIHHLRHSFANWQWIRLMLPNLALMRQQFSFLNHDYFSDASVSRLTARLGVASYSHNRGYAVALMLGHTNPTQTLKSYIHIASLCRYAGATYYDSPSRKLVNSLFPRAELASRQQAGDNFAERMLFYTQAEKQLTDNALTPLFVTGQVRWSLPVAITAPNSAVGDITMPSPEVWARVFAIMPNCNIEHIVRSLDVDHRLLTLAKTVCDELAVCYPKVFRNYSAIPVIPTLEPMGTAIADYKYEDGRVLLTLLQQLDELVNDNSNKLDWAMVAQVTEIIGAATPGKGYVIRSGCAVQLRKYLRLLARLKLNNLIWLKLHILPNADPISIKSSIQKLRDVLVQEGLANVCIEECTTKEAQYFKPTNTGWVLEVSLRKRNNRKQPLPKGPRRQRVFFQFLHMAAVLSRIHCKVVGLELQQVANADWVEV